MTDPGEGITNTASCAWSYDAISRLTQEKYDYGNDDPPTSVTAHTTDDYTNNFVYDLDSNCVMQTTDTLVVLVVDCL